MMHHEARPPLVSVLMITYNHGEYLAQAIEGVLAQRCRFAFELLIGEDASTDGTAAIARRYEYSFPGIVRVISSSTNVGMNENFRRLVQQVRGEYVAYCEGDDIWCLATKLQKQVELLESDPSLGMVHTDWIRMSRSSGAWKLNSRSQLAQVPRRLLYGDLFSTFHLPSALRTCTVMVPRKVLNQCEASALRAGDYRFVDTVHAALITSGWRVGYLDEVCAIYRESENSALRSGTPARIRYLHSALEFDSVARRYFDARGDYPISYRWEMAVGLLLWSVKGRDRRAFLAAAADLYRHFSALDGIRCGVKSLWIRRRAFWRRSRHLPTLSPESLGEPRG